MKKLLVFWVAVGLFGCGLVLDAGVHGRPVEFVIGGMIALGVETMLGTGWWLRWQRTVEPEEVYCALWSDGDADDVTWPETDWSQATFTHVITPDGVIDLRDRRHDDRRQRRK